MQVLNEPVLAEARKLAVATEKAETAKSNEDSINDTFSEAIKSNEESLPLLEYTSKPKEEQTLCQHKRLNQSQIRAN